MQSGLRKSSLWSQEQTRRWVMKIQRERGSGQPLGMLLRAQGRAGQRGDSELGNTKLSVTFTKTRHRSRKDEWLYANRCDPTAGRNCWWDCRWVGSVKRGWLFSGILVLKEQENEAVDGRGWESREVSSQRGKCMVVCRQVYGSTAIGEIINEDRGDEWRHGILTKAKGNASQRIRGLWLVWGKLKPGHVVVVVGTWGGSWLMASGLRSAEQWPWAERGASGILKTKENTRNSPLENLRFMDSVELMFKGFGVICFRRN